MTVIVLLDEWGTTVSSLPLGVPALAGLRQHSNSKHESLRHQQSAEQLQFLVPVAHEILLAVGVVVLPSGTDMNNMGMAAYPEAQISPVRFSERTAFKSRSSEDGPDV